MPSFTIKWLFSQFRTKLVSSHRFNIFSKWDRHVEKESPKNEKSSINTSIVFSKWDSQVYGNLKITQEAIEETIVLISCESFEHLIHEGKWKVVLSSSFIQLSIVNAYSPPCDQ
ncbi:hypothetical protein Tco_0183650 [Tanacetum coccineum]